MSARFSVRDDGSTSLGPDVRLVDARRAGARRAKTQNRDERAPEVKSASDIAIARADRLRHVMLGADGGRMATPAAGAA